jgi:hypothetical protein
MQFEIKNNLDMFIENNSLKNETQTENAKVSYYFNFWLV